MTCTKHNYMWRPATNEDGWHCTDCGDRPGDPPGFSPALDVELVREKVEGLIFLMHEFGMIYMSNSDHGVATAHEVAERCRAGGRYDQGAILHYMCTPSDYWKRIADGVRAGADERERCSCGKLATSFCGKERRCNECERLRQGSLPF